MAIVAGARSDPLQKTKTHAEMCCITAGRNHASNFETFASGQEGTDDFGFTPGLQASKQHTNLSRKNPCKVNNDNVQGSGEGC